LADVFLSIKPMGEFFEQPFYSVRADPVFRYNYTVNSEKLFLVTACVLILSGCVNVPITPAISLPEFVTATLPPTATLAATLTPLPPTVVPTITPIAGTTTTEVNVRASTSTASKSLGTIPAFSAIQIIGKDGSGNWLQILFNGGIGWVRADYVRVEDASVEIPVMGEETGTGAGIRGVVLRGLNIRSGPGRDFESLGLLNQNDVVSILGKDASGMWMKIEYPAAPDGTGWIAAEFMQVNNPDAISVIGETAQPPEAESTATDTTSVAAPQAKIALADGDTANAPLALFSLSADSARSVQFKGEISAPEGDSEDWLGFSSQSTEVVIQVSCDSDGIQVELFQADGATSLLKLDCNNAQLVQVNPEKIHLLKVSPVLTDASVFIKYEIRVELNK
jgi:uncharacterized protein YraI